MSAPIAHLTRSYTEHSPAVKTEEPTASRTLSRQRLATAVIPVLAYSRRYPYEFILKWYIPVLDEELGKSLEWRQLRNHPRRKEVWQQLYKNNLGRLCQGVSKVKDGPKQQRVSGSATFFFF